MADEPQGTLFGDDPDLEGMTRPAKVPAPGVARVLMPNRIQVELRPSDLQSLLPEGHRARLVDLSRIYAGIRAVAGGSGHTAIAPEILITLWLYATLEGVGTARELARLTQAHDAYRWICGFGPPLTVMRVLPHTPEDERHYRGAAAQGQRSRKRLVGCFTLNANSTR